MSVCNLSAQGSPYQWNDGKLGDEALCKAFKHNHNFSSSLKPKYPIKIVWVGPRSIVAYLPRCMPTSQLDLSIIRGYRPQCYLEPMAGQLGHMLPHKWWPTLSLRRGDMLWPLCTTSPFLPLSLDPWVLWDKVNSREREMQKQDLSRFVPLLDRRVLKVHSYSVGLDDTFYHMWSISKDATKPTLWAPFSKRACPMI